MGATPWSTTLDLEIAELLDGAKHFSFFQLNQLIQRYQDKSSLEEPIKKRFSAKKSLAFPSSDIDLASLRETPVGQEIQLVVTFMGLFGPSSPLPAYYTERLLHSDDESEAMRQFLDLINHHMIDKLQQTWEKYRYYIQYQSGQYLPGKDQLTRWVFDLVGFPSIEQLDSLGLDWHKLLPLGSLFSIKAKNAAALKQILGSYFSDSDFDIEECIERLVTVPEDQRHLMGVDNASMGMNLVLGDQVADRMGKLRIHIYMGSGEDFKDYLPGASRNLILVNLVQLYLRDQFAYDFCLHVSAEGMMSSTMGEQGLSLGWTACMGETQYTDDLAVVI